MSVTHDIERTSPKGQNFVGRCIRCGAVGLSMADALQPCANTRGITDEEAWDEIILGPDASEEVKA